MIFPRPLFVPFASPLERARQSGALVTRITGCLQSGSRRYEVDTRPVRFKVDARLEGETSNSRVISERSKGCSGPWDPINAWSVCCHGDVDVEAGRVTRSDAPNF